ncbi:Caudovirus prohead protease [Azospira oryzae PS]|uniref:Caudovirus prohead protease n=1 Tax=Azospira oryzae (strain ATCC BAA-33 / DSM 13638 / PS) TaxID=640081 RepID=G8QMN5_AZOOP|nr:HK97 family phage prohead protease [Azospira oryzae]AEV24615.1 Caudovirus prohead protease [Azospira oryzae PS]
MLKKIFACLDLSKTEELEDGTLKVWGYASSEAEDSDGETITADAMKAALPDYLKWGAVREMHQPKAAGTAIEAEVQDDGKTWFGAHIVDTEAVKKVKTGVYKGFSIGGKVTERDELNKAIIKGLKLIEVSLVDRPANPEAVLTMYKAETVEDDEPAAVDQLADLLNKGEITPERLLELAKGEKTEPGSTGENPVVQPAQDDIKKGMYGVSRMADLLQSISYLAQDTEWEAQYEGDDSPLPQQLRDWLAQGAGILKAMAEEEINELLAGLQVATKAAGVDDLAKVTGGKLAKAGARFSKSTKEALGAIHKAAKDACDHLDKLGYDAEKDDEEEGADKGAKADDLAKVSAAHDDLLKAIGAAGCPEGTVAADFVKALATQRDDLQKRVQELEAKPAQGKALLKAIAKSADAGTVETDSAEKVEPIADPKGEVNEVATLIKSIHAGKAA